jgi:hypothetical protein
MNDSQTSSQALPAGTRLEEFVIERVLGSGGFGITYLAAAHIAIISSPPTVATSWAFVLS